MVRRRRRRGRLIAGIAVAVVLLGGGAAIANGRRAQPPPEGEIVEVVRQDLTERVSASGNIVPPTARQLDFAAGGDIVEVAVAAGDRVTAGQLLGRVDDADLRQAVTTTEAELAAAEARLAQARAGVTEADRDAAATGVEQAEVGLDAARRSLASAQRTAAAAGSRQVGLDQARTERDRAAAEAHAAHDALAHARAALHAAEAADPPDAAAVAAAQEAVAAAEQRDGAARQALDAASAAARSAEAEAEVAAAQEAAQEAAARSEVEAAAAGLDAAQASAAQATQDPRPEAVEEAEAGVTTARATHEGALRDLAGAVVTAPADGLVTEVNGRVGEPSGAAAATVLTGDAGGAGTGVAEGATGAAASSGSSFVTLVDAAVREVRVGFPEVDAARLEVGQPAEVTFDAVEGPPVGGRVVAVDPSSSTVNNVVTYYARVALDTVPEGVRLGMTATTEVEVRTIEDAVVVPAGALRQDDGETVVQVAGSEDPEDREDRPVRIGLRADGVVEILEGLEPGDRVVVPDPDADPAAGAAPPGEAGA